MSREKISVFEVGPRDGIQNEALAVSLPAKTDFINDLLAAGIRDFEMGAFVRADRVPQMADTEKLYAAIQSRKIRIGRAREWSLVPNRRGLERAQAAGAKRIAIFTAASESFANRNIGMSIRESLAEFKLVVRDARAQGMVVRGYVSTAFGCPFEGKVAPSKALSIIEKLADMGCAQVSVGDTIGVATPRGVDQVIKPALRLIGADCLAGHFHDTRGTALANALRSIEHGGRVLDSSAGGLGGCPFAPGATGNLATEDLVYMLEGMGFDTGIHLERLARASLRFFRRLRRPLACRYLQAFAAAL